MIEMTFSTIQFEAKKISLVVRIANFIRLFAKSPSNWISLRIAKNLMRDTKFIEQQIALVQQMDTEQVKAASAFVQHMLPILVKMDKAINEIENQALSMAFRKHEMAIYKFEAKLHVKQTEHLPVMPTDPELREALHYNTILCLTSRL
ncbi:hypothetical protein ACWKW6_07525 [Dyadobacter jiangsuensis]